MATVSTKRLTRGKAKKNLTKESLRFFGLSIAFAILIIALFRFSNLLVSETRIGLYALQISKYEGIRDSALSSASDESLAAPYRRLHVSDAESADARIEELSLVRDNCKKSGNSLLAFAARNGFSIIYWLASLVATLGIAYVIACKFPSWGTYKLYVRTVKRIKKLCKYLLSCSR